MPTQINILIVEDNVIIADDLQQVVEDIGYNVVDNVVSYEQAIDVFQKNKVDLVLLDINLATEKTGIDLAEYINLNFNIPFIYLTSNLDNEVVSKAAKTFPSSYLVKPFDSNTIYTSIEIAVTNFFNKNLDKNLDKNLKKNLFLKKNNLYHKISIDKLSYIKSDNIYLEIYTDDNQKFLIRSTLKSFLAGLPSNFFKCNKSYIVNINNVKTFNLNYVFINDIKISVSKEFKPFLKSLLK